MSGSAHDSHALLKREEASFRLDFKPRPIPGVLFRPEEVDPASRVGKISVPVSNGNINIGTNPRRFLAFDGTVAHCHAQRITAVQTEGLDYYRLPRKEPADRQRLEPSLGEPFLLPVHRDAVLRGQIVEGRERRDQIGVREQPYRQRKSGVHQLVQ